MMSRLRWYLLGGCIGVGALVVWWALLPAAEVVVDLVDRLPQATQRRPSPDAFQVADIRLDGQVKRSIFVTTQSRLAFEEVVPRHAWLQVSLGVREEAWVKEGAGVLFMVGVSHGGTYEELISLIVNPYSNAADRQWLPVLLDLSPWEGEQIELILNTREAYPGAGVANHFAVWGAPAVVTR